MRQGDYFGCLDRGAAPDAQAGRRVAIGADVERDLLLFEQARKALGERRLGVGGQRGHVRIDHFQADAGVRARLGSLGEETDPGRFGDPIGDRLEIGVGAPDQGVEPADRLRPLQRVDIIFDAEHRWRVDRLAFEYALDQLAALGHAEQLGQRPGGLVSFEPFNGARAQHDHAMSGLAAERLLPGESDDIEPGPIKVLREGGGGRVANRQALAIGGDPVGIGDAHARSRAVPGEDDVMVEIDAAPRFTGSSP